MYSRALSLVCFRFFFCILFTTVPVSATTLPESVNMALASHPEMLIERLEQDIQGSVLAQVEAAFLPKIALSLGIGREDSNNASTRARIGGSEEMERRESAVTVQQMLFDGFDSHWQQQGQEAEIEAAKFELVHAAASLALKTIDAHLSLVKARKLYEFNRGSFDAHEKISESIKARVKSGKDDRAKVAQVDARLALAMANLETARTARLQAEVAYKKLVGKQPGAKLQSATKVDLPESWEEVRDRLALNNPLLAAKRSHKEAAEKRQKASDSDYMPSLYFESGASWNDNLDGVSGRNSDAYAMFRLRYDLYQGGAMPASRKQAGFARKKAELQLDSALLDVEAEAELAWLSYHSLAKRVVFLERYIESALQTREAYQKQFNIGQRSLIDLLDAESELLQAREQWLDTQVQYRLSAFKLSRMMGALLSSLTVSLR